MITRNELQNIAKDNAEIISGFYPLINQKFIERIFLEGVLCAYYKCSYSREDMMSFAEYCSHQFNVCDPFGNWYHEWGEKEDTKTTQQLLKEWEEQKNG